MSKDKPKKIILTVTNDLVYDQRMIRICTTLSNAGYELLLIGRIRSFSKALLTRPYQQKRLRCFFNKGKFFYLEYNFRLFIFLLFHRFDIVCSIDLDTILPGYFVAKWKRKKCVYDAHEYFTEVPEVINRPFTKSVWEWVAQRTIPNLQYCYTVGNGLATIFKERYKTNFTVIRNVPFSQEYVKTTKKENIILYQGALNEGRGIEEAIQAMASIDNAILWLAGEGDLSQSLRALVEELKLGDKVIFLGYLEPKELKKITMQASIGLNLLQNKSLNYYYSLANKAFDYMQVGIPAIHMNFPEYQLINEQNEVAVLIDDLKIPSIVNAIQLLINDTTLYQRLVKNCLSARSLYNWEKERQILIDFYKRIDS